MTQAQLKIKEFASAPQAIAQKNCTQSVKNWVLGAVSYVFWKKLRKTVLQRQIYLQTAFVALCIVGVNTHRGDDISEECDLLLEF